MTKINFVGKCLLIEEERKKILVIGDLHLGYEGSLQKSGIFVEGGLFKENLEYLDGVFEKIGKVNEIVLLGDVKHEFGKIIWEERKEVVEFLEYLFMRTGRVVIVKGNHDMVVEYIPNVDKVKLFDYCVLGENCFLHGDRDFDGTKDKKIKRLIIGHAHPAIKLEEKNGAKIEKFKCFLVGKFEGKEIVIVPSFFEGSVGSDVRERNLGLAWNFKLKNFRVRVVQEESLETLDFGKLSSLD
ncbi:metallophosphoesterase [Candidatus Pacearchaeota archaeon]|nr:metallophosphoesterase [Candidatus Pacearchaeota archaeon]